jgi:hypothetical protein
MKDVVRSAHQSGAIDELATAVHEAMISARDKRIERTRDQRHCY